MKAKEYLQQLQKLDIIINQKLQELDELKKMGGIKCIDCTMEKVQSSQKHCATFENVLIKIIDMENEINTDIDKLVNKRHCIINQINELQNVQYIEILYKRYVEYKDLKKIAKEMEYTYDYIRKIHVKALQNFEKRHTIAH